MLRGALASARLVVLELRELSFIDTAGVHVIVDASVQALLEGRRLMVAFAPEGVAAIFALTGTSDAVEIFDLNPCAAPNGAHLHLALDFPRFGLGKLRAAYPHAA